MTVYRRPDPIPLPDPARDSTTVLWPVRADPADLNRLVAREIFNAIAGGRFPAGSILPNEHQLATDLKVSRTALREAIKGLASKGLVETRRKRGTLVLDRGRWNMLDADVIGWLRRSGPSRISEELWAALKMTQPTLAAAAATRRYVGDLALSIAAISSAASAQAKREAFGQMLLEMSHAGGNRFLGSLTSACVSSLISDDAPFLDRAISELNLASLELLPALIQAGKAEAAREAMTACLSPALVAA